MTYKYVNICYNEYSGNNFFVGTNIQRKEFKNLFVFQLLINLVHINKQKLFIIWETITSGNYLPLSSMLSNTVQILTYIPIASYWQNHYKMMLPKSLWKFSIEIKYGKTRIHKQDWMYNHAHVCVHALLRYIGTAGHMPK